MSTLLPLFAVTILLAAALATLSLWAPRRLAAKLLALLLAMGFMPMAYAAMAELLSKPKPATIEWALAGAGEATVLGSLAREDEAIYLWLQLADVPEPRAYMLPWSRKLAEQLQEAQRQAAERGSGLRMRLPFEPTLDDREPRFYAMPQPALPPKDEALPPATILRPPGTDA